MTTVAYVRYQRQKPQSMRLPSRAHLAEVINREAVRATKPTDTTARDEAAKVLSDDVSADTGRVEYAPSYSGLERSTSVSVTRASTEGWHVHG